MEIYLDNSATTRVHPEVVALMVKIMEEDYGNAASLHRKGAEAERYVTRAREQVAKTLKTEPGRIYFTSGGTESNNWALIGAAEANRRAGTHIITTSVEHPSVRKTLAHLEELGYSVTYLPTDRDGLVSVKDVEDALRPDTILVSCMYVNNEIGAVEPVEEIGRMLYKKRPDVLLHADAVQAYGKFVIRPERDHIDLLSCSGHKLRGPKGVGFLYISGRTKIRPILYGGGQQKGMRSGTENVPGAAGLGLAAELAYRDLARDTEVLRQRKEELIGRLSALPGVRFNGRTDGTSAPHILSVSFEGVRSEVMLHALEDRGIYVSAGSACASRHPSEISTLSGIGLSKEAQEGTIRFSLNSQNTEEEIRRTADAVGELLPVLRRFKRR